MATINNSKSNTLLSGSSGNDFIYNKGSQVTIDSNAGDDHIDNWSSHVTISGDAGNDTIITVNDADENSISGGAGDDFINLQAPSDTFTINGGRGNDTVYWDNTNSPNILYEYNKGDGNDVIYCLIETSTLQIDGGIDTYSTQVSGYDLLVKVGNDTITLKNAYAITDSIHINNDVINLKRKVIKLSKGGDKITTRRDSLSVVGGAGDDYIHNWRGNFVTIAGGKGDDSITNYSSKVSINAGEGNDYIYNSTHNVTLNSGSGNDSISSNGYNVIINAAEGNDSIFSSGNSVTIDAGMGNDYLIKHGSNALLNYKSGDGNDTIEGFGPSDTLTITSASYSTQESGYDVLVKVGSNTITLKNVYATADSIHINNKAINLERKVINLADDGEKVTIGRGYLSVVGGVGDDSIHNNKESSSVSINSGAGDDSISNLGANVTINSGTGDDAIDNNGSNVSIDAGDGNDDIYNYTWEGLPVIINGNTGDDTIDNNASNSSIIGGAGDDSISLDGYNNQIFYNVGDGFDTIEGLTSNDTINIFGATYTRSTINNDVLVEVDDGSILLKGATSLSSVNIVEQKNITIDDTATSPMTLDAVTETVDASERTTKIQITGNDLDNSIVGGKGNDTLNGAGGNDTLTGGNGKNTFIHDSGNDIITDYKDKKDKINLSTDYQSYAIYGDDLLFNYGDNNSLTIQEGEGKVINTVRNKKKVANVYVGEGILDGKKKSITLTDEATLFEANVDKIYSKLVTIDASAAENDVYILGNKKKNKIIAGDNGSTLDGGKGKNTLIGGKGADVFIYNPEYGKDIIENYGTEDKIFLASELTIKDVKVKKDSTVIKVKNGSLTVNNTTEFSLTGGSFDSLFSDGVLIANGTAKVYSSFNGTIDLNTYDNVIIADASLAKKAVTINGGINSDSLYGGKGNDKIYGNADYGTFIGGKGNDSLWGGDDYNVFVYEKGDGKDIIYGFDDDDMLRISGTFSASYNERKEEISIKVGSTSNAITLKDFSATSFNINGTNYKISGNTLSNT